MGLGPPVTGKQASWDVAGSYLATKALQLDGGANFGLNNNAGLGTLFRRVDAILTAGAALSVRCPRNGWSTDMTGILDKFHVEHGGHGAKVLARTNQMTRDCLTDEDIDDAIQCSRMISTPAGGR